MQSSLSVRAVSALAVVAGLAAAQDAGPAPGGIVAAPPVGLRFIENAGQWDGDSAFAVRVGPAQVFFETGAMVVQLHERRPIQGPGVQIAGVPSRPEPTLPQVEVRFAFDGAAAAPAPRDQLPGVHHFYLGADASRWRTGLRAWAALEYRELWPGIALALHERDGALHYDVVVDPGADLDAFALRAEGAAGARVDTDGSLLADTVRGAIRQTIPAAWEEDAAGHRTPIVARFVARGGSAPSFGLQVEGRDPSRRLVIDPGFDFAHVYGSGLGPFVDLVYYSTGFDDFWEQQYVAGYDGGDAIVSSYVPSTGALQWSTLIGGEGVDEATDMALLIPGAGLYVCGVTDSLALPTTPGAFQEVAPGLGDAFVAAFTPNGLMVVLSYVGGALGTEAGNTTIDADPENPQFVLLAGYTESVDFPIEPSPASTFDGTYNGGGDVWVMRMNEILNFVMDSTYLGGALADVPGIHGLARGPDFSVTVGGWTDSPGFPMLAAIDPIYSGLTDPFLAKFDVGLNTLIFSTFRGGAAFDAFNAVAVDQLFGDVFGAGYTESALAGPMGPPGVLDIGYNGGGDVLLVEHDPLGGFASGTYRGGDGGESAIDVVVDWYGRPHISGTTNSGYGTSVTPYPFTPPAGFGPFDPVGVSNFDGFVECIGPDADLNSFAGYYNIQAGGDEAFNGIALDFAGNAYVAGNVDAIGPPSGGLIARCTFPWRDEDNSSAYSGNMLLMGDGTLVGGAPLEVRFKDLVPGAALLLVGATPLFQPFAGGTMVPNPTLIVPITIPPGGNLVLGSVWPASFPAGFQLWLQLWEHDPNGPPPLSWAATNGLRMTPP